jgi:nitrogen fixation NifU-like protein
MAASMDDEQGARPKTSPDDIPEDRYSFEPISGPMLFYNDQVIEHFTNPRNVGELEKEAASGFGLVGDPLCGDQMKLWIEVVSGRIARIRFRSFGCPGAIATSSMLTVLAEGRTIGEAWAITDDDVVEALGGIPERKKHCSLLGVRALRAAIDDYEKRSSAVHEDST